MIFGLCTNRLTSWLFDKLPLFRGYEERLMIRVGTSQKRLVLLCAENKLFVALIEALCFFLGFGVFCCCGVPSNHKIPRPGVLSLSFSSFHDF